MSESIPMSLIEILDIGSQIVITCTGFFSLYLMASQSARTRMWGGVVGLAGEPFWLTTAIINHQWGVIILCFVFGYNWARVVYSNYKNLGE